MSSQSAAKNMTVTVTTSGPVKTLSFIPKIRGARDILKLTVGKFIQKAQEKGCKPDFTLQEHFTAGTPVKPFYDWDAKYKTVPTAEELPELEKSHLTEFQAIVEKLHPGKTIEYAQRHGALQGCGDYVYKISFRAFVQGVRSTVLDIPRHVRAVLGLGPKETHANLDLSVYKAKEQLLAVIKGCKDTDVIKRYLMPLDRTASLGAFLAQNVEDDDEELVVQTPSGPDVSVARKRGRPRKSAPGSIEPAAGGSAGGSADASASVDGDGGTGSSYVDVTSDGNTAVVLSSATEFFEIGRAHV